HGLGWAGSVSRRRPRRAGGLLAAVWGLHGRGRWTGSTRTLVLGAALGAAPARSPAVARFGGAGALPTASQCLLLLLLNLWWARTKDCGKCAWRTALAHYIRNLCYCG